MKTIFYFATVIVVFTFFTQQINAQPIGAYSIQDGAGVGFSPSVIELSGNRTLLISYSYFGNDSSFVKMVWLDQNMNVISHKEFRLVFALNYLFHAVKCPGGFLIGGLEYGGSSSRMYIVRTDTAGNVLRYDLCYYNPLWQEKIIQLIANNNGSFTGYSSVSNISDAMYRIDGNVADTLFHFKKITPVITNNYFRPLGAIDIDGNGTHLLSGSMHDVAGSNRNAMLLKLDSNQVIWGKSYDYGQTFIEEAFNVIKLSNGNFAFVGDGVAGTGTYFDGYITVADATGENVWSRKLSITGGGVYPKTLLQTASGDILVFCSTHTYQGAILKFSEAGALLSSTIFTAPGGNTYFGNSIRRTDNTILASGVSGALMIMKLDDNGNGGLKRIRTAVEAFAELCLAARPSDLMPANVNDKAVYANHFTSCISFLINGDMTISITPAIIA